VVDEERPEVLNLDELSRAWDTAWPGVVPVGHEVRFYGRWIRFHCLPDSGFPESEDDFRTALHRQLAVLDAVNGAAEAQSFLLLTYEDEYDPGPPCAPVADTPLWRSFQTEDDDPPVYRVHASRQPWDTLSTLLNWQLRENGWCLLAADDLSWLFAPYEGGMDVVGSTEERDRLHIRFADWAAPWNDWHPITKWRGPDLRQ
jgi:hypothetical protein